MVFKLAGFAPLANSNEFQASEQARKAPDSLSPYQGTIFKPFGLVDELNFEHLDRPQTWAHLDWLRESRATLLDWRTTTVKGDLFVRTGLFHPLGIVLATIKKVVIAYPAT
jgi:hypothetical protein